MCGEFTPDDGSLIDLTIVYRPQLPPLNDVSKTGKEDRIR